MAERTFPGIFKGLESTFPKTEWNKTTVTKPSSAASVTKPPREQPLEYEPEAQAILVLQAEQDGTLTTRKCIFWGADLYERNGEAWYITRHSDGAMTGCYAAHCNEEKLSQLLIGSTIEITEGTAVRTDYSLGRPEHLVAQISFAEDILFHSPGYHLTES